MYKKLLAIIFAILFIFAFCACNSSRRMKKEPHDSNINSHTEEMSPEEMVCGSWAHTDDTGLTTTFTLNQDKTGSIYMTVEEYNYSEKRTLLTGKSTEIH